MSSHDNRGTALIYKWGITRLTGKCNSCLLADILKVQKFSFKRESVSHICSVNTRTCFLNYGWATFCLLMPQLWINKGGLCLNCIQQFETHFWRRLMVTIQFFTYCSRLTLVPNLRPAQTQLTNYASPKNWPNIPEHVYRWIKSNPPVFTLILIVNRIGVFLHLLWRTIPRTKVLLSKDWNIN